jgi:hypothetical protein
VAEWFKAPVLKSVIRRPSPFVLIPKSPCLLGFYCIGDRTNSSSGSSKIVSDLNTCRCLKCTNPIEQMLAKSAFAVSTSSAMKSETSANAIPYLFAGSSSSDRLLTGRPTQHTCRHGRDINLGAHTGHSFWANINQVSGPVSWQLRDVDPLRPSARAAIARAVAASRSVKCL